MISDWDGADGGRRATWSIEPNVLAPGAARVVVRDQLQTWGYADRLVDDAELGTSELVSSVVLRSAGPSVAVTLSAMADEVRVSVEDGTLPPNVLEGGALRVVESIADQWGARLTPDRATLWFVVRPRPGAAG